MLRIKQIKNFILDILFPRSKMDKKIDLITAKDLFDRCLKTTHEKKNVVTIFSYDNNLIRQTIWSLKFRRNKKLAKVFAQILYDEILEKLSEEMLFFNFKKPILVPIPISKKRLRERGFNQVELIAKEMSLLDMNNSFIFKKDILLKHQDTPHQSRAKNKKERLENIKNSFSIKNKKEIKDKNIILLDDITTTGATLNEAKKILRRNGAKKIICLTIAH